MIWPLVGESHCPSFWFHCSLDVNMRLLFSQLSYQCDGCRSGGFSSRHGRYNRMRPIRFTTKRVGYLHRRPSYRHRRPHYEICAGAHTRQISTSGSDAASQHVHRESSREMDVRRSVIISRGSIQAVRTPLAAIRSGGYVLEAALSARTNKGDDIIGAVVLAHIWIPMAAMPEDELPAHSWGLENRQIRKSQIE